MFSCSFISSISLCIASICSFSWLSFSSFSECHTRFPKQTKCYLYVCQDLVPYI
jgi:hypothetical protein